MHSFQPIQEQWEINNRLLPIRFKHTAREEHGSMQTAESNAYKSSNICRF